MKSIKSLVDQYADITRQIKLLELKQEELAAQIKSHGAGRYKSPLLLDARPPTGPVFALRRAFLTPLSQSTPLKGRIHCA